MSRKVVRRLQDAGMLVIGLVALLALVLLGLRGWGCVCGESRDAVPADGEREDHFESRGPEEPVEGQSGRQAEPLGKDGSGRGTPPVTSVTSASDVSVHDEAGEVEQVATRLLASYRDEGNCVLVEASYLDLLGSVWGCVVQGDQWVDICVVEQTDESSSRVHVMRLDASEVADELDADNRETLGSGKDGDG